MQSLPRPQFPKKRRRRSLRTSLFFQAFSLLMLSAIGAAVTGYLLAHKEFTLRTISDLHASLHRRETLLEETIARQKEHVSIIGRDPTLAGVLSVTRLVGFQSLCIVESHGITTPLEGRCDSLPSSIRGRVGSEGATLFESITKDGNWTSYVISAPRFSGGVQNGRLIALFDAENLATSVVADVDGMKSLNVSLLWKEDDETIILHRDASTGRAVRVIENAQHSDTNVIRQSMEGEHGIVEGRDVSGIEVVGVYRRLPSLGWTILAAVDTYEVHAPTVRIAMNLVGVGSLIVILLSLSMYAMSRRIAGPIEELARKIKRLETKHWHFDRTITSGNEIEDVDEAAYDLTERLRRAHEHLQAIIVERTASVKKGLAENKTILESMDYGLLLSDGAGKVSYMNRMAEELTQKTASEKIGTPASDVLRIQEKSGTLLEGNDHPVSKVLATKSRYSLPADEELSLARSDGSVVPLHIRAAPVMIGKECLGVVAVFRDVTEERQIDHMKSEFISLISHQLRTPLSAIRWYIEMLMEADADPLTDEQRSFLAEIESSNIRMVHLVNALLNVSRLELGTMEMRLESLVPGEVLREILKDVQSEMDRKRISWKIEGEDSNKMQIMSDKALLRLILENILSNATKYSTEGSAILLSVRPLAAKKKVEITVQNSGIGIPEDQKSLVGKKLFRASNARISETDGNGLGIYISKIAAEAIGATLDFQSDHGITTFTITLPMDEIAS